MLITHDVGGWTRAADAGPSVVRVITTRWWPAPRDAALAALTAVGVVVITLLLERSSDRPLWPGGVLLIVAGAVALAWRRVAPLPVLVLTLAAVAPYYLLGFPDGPASALVGVSVYTVASRSGWVRSVVVGLVLLALWVGLEQLIAWRDAQPVGDRDHYAWIAAVVAAGVAVGGVRRAQAAVAERAEERARRRIEQERLRIARQVHDVVSHSLSTIAVRAGVGAHVADRRPDEAVAALREITETSRAALAELRATLDLLRADDLDDLDRAEAAGLERLDEVVRVARLAGLDVAVRGSAGTLGAEADDAAFRIVREAVTNTVRHARRARLVVVTFERDDADLRIRVVDDGEAPATFTPGHGLRGLEEQAAAVGGHASARPGEPGFVVEAVLPAVDR